MKYLTLIERFEDFKKQLSYLRVRAPRGPAWCSIFHSRALNAVHDNAVHHCTQGSEGARERGCVLLPTLECVLLPTLECVLLPTLECVLLPTIECVLLPTLECVLLPTLECVLLPTVECVLLPTIECVPLPTVYDDHA